MQDTISNSVDTPGGVVDTSFAGFIRTPAGQSACGSDLIARLTPSAGNITSLRALVQWARERFPGEHGPEDWRQPPSIAKAPHGCQAMRKIWAAFLAWKEGGQAV